MELVEIEKSLVKTLIYFDVFSYPLLPEEIIMYCGVPGLNKDEGFKILDDLLARKIINYKDEFYYLGNNTSKIKERIEGNQLAKKRLTTAKIYSSIIANFPFVRAVFISGSLSKNFMKEDGDLDFFIITKPGKLWLCRALLTIFKKLFLLNSHRNFCLNYFIDSNNLVIPDKNIFTATEIAFILPMNNYQLYTDFMTANNWYKENYPNILLRENGFDAKIYRIKYFFEFLLNNGIGKKLNNVSFRIILGYWRKKFDYLDEKNFSLNLRSRKDVSKHHPNAFQSKVINAYQAGVRSYLKQLSV